MKKKRNQNRRKHIVLAGSVAGIGIFLFAIYIYLELGNLVFCNLSNSNSHIICTNFHSEQIGKTPYPPYLTEVKNWELRAVATATEGAKLCSKQNHQNAVNAVVDMDHNELHILPSGLSPVATSIPKGTEVQIVTASSSADGVFTWYLVLVDNQCLWSAEAGLRIID